MHIYLLVVAAIPSSVFEAELRLKVNAYKIYQRRNCGKIHRGND